MIYWEPINSYVYIHVHLAMDPLLMHHAWKLNIIFHTYNWFWAWSPSHPLHQFHQIMNSLHYGLFIAVTFIIHWATVTQTSFILMWQGIFFSIKLIFNAIHACSGIDLQNFIIWDHPLTLHGIVPMNTTIAPQNQFPGFSVAVICMGWFCKQKVGTKKSIKIVSLYWVQHSQI